MRGSFERYAVAIDEAGWITDSGVSVHTDQREMSGVTRGGERKGNAFRTTEESKKSRISG